MDGYVQPHAPTVDGSIHAHEEHASRHHRISQYRGRRRQRNPALAEATELTKVLNKREMFDEMRQKNPALEKLRSLLDLELT